jgi:hypothetical protein
MFAVGKEGSCTLGVVSVTRNKAKLRPLCLYNRDELRDQLSLRNRQGTPDRYIVRDVTSTPTLVAVSSRTGPAGTLKVTWNSSQEITCDVRVTG